MPNWYYLQKIPRLRLCAFLSAATILIQDTFSCLDFHRSSTDSLYLCPCPPSFILKVAARVKPLKCQSIHFSSLFKHLRWLPISQSTSQAFSFYDLINPYNLQPPHLYRFPLHPLIFPFSFYSKFKVIFAAPQSCLGAWTFAFAFFPVYIALPPRYAQGFKRHLLQILSK